MIVTIDLVRRIIEVIRKTDDGLERHYGETFWLGPDHTLQIAERIAGPSLRVLRADDLDQGLDPRVVTQGD
jgi:hypothetical protein